MIVELRKTREAMAGRLQNFSFYGRIKTLPQANQYNKS